MTRGIVDPDEVEVPRRKGEGTRAIFDRDEIREALLQHQPPTEQRVMIITEPLEEYEKKLRKGGVGEEATGDRRGEGGAQRDKNRCGTHL